MDNYLQIGNIDQYINNSNEGINIINDYDNLPEDMKNSLKQLNILNLSGKKLTKIPDNIGKLENIKLLILSFNPKLTELPESMKNLNKLQVLYASGCGFRKIPKFLGEINSPNLYSVQLDNNNIDLVDETLLNLQETVNINLSDQKPIGTNIIKVDKRVVDKFEENFTVNGGKNKKIKVKIVDFEKEKELHDTVRDKLEKNTFDANMENSSMGSLSKLPNSNLQNIFSFLDTKSLGRLTSTNKKLNSLKKKGGKNKRKTIKNNKNK